MKTILQVLTVIAVLVINSQGFAQYSSPESVTYDPVGKRYLISNTSSGKIVQRSQAGVVTDFVTPGSGVQGITYYNGNVYCCQGANIKGYSLATGLSVLSVTLPLAMNDIAVDTNGFLYTSNFSSSTRKIYKINTANSAFWEFATATRQPNGLYVDYKRNRLLVVSWGTSAIIQAVKLNDSTNVTTVLPTFYSNFDGISLDRNDHVYISSYSQGVIIRLDINFVTSPVEISTGHSSPADIYVNRFTDTLAVPNAGNSTVSFIPLTIPTGVTGQTGIISNYKLEQNYPNPFNPSAIINYECSMYNFTTLKVYDVMGKEVKVLVNENKAPGKYSVTFDGTGLSSGVYFYELKAGEFRERKKMLLVK